MNKTLTFFIISLLFGSIFITGTLKSSSDTIPVIEYPEGLELNFTTTIDLYVDPHLDTEILSSIVNILDGRMYPLTSAIDFVTTNILEVNLIEIEQQDRDEFVSYLHTIENSDSPNGHEFNETAYDLGESRVFTNITGRSYDAELALNWLGDNMWDGTTNKFSLYTFNFTELDDGLDHWFEVNPLDVDTGIPQTTFFSGTSGLVHGKSVSAWGGHAGFPIHFIDLSAESWWGDFLEHIYTQYGWSADIISSKLQDFDTQDDIDDFIGDYLFSFIDQTYDLRLFNGAPLGKTAKVQSIVLHDWYDYGYSISESQWILSSEKIETGFEKAFPYIDFNVTDEWYNLSEYENLVNEMQQYKVLQPDGVYHLELTTGLLSYLTSVFVPNNFDFEGEDIILPSLVFLLNNTVFTYGGIPIAGLGGMGYQLQGLVPNRYLSSNGSHLRGFSDVILHEVGHSLGLPHPFSNFDNWAGDMTASVMGYYTSAPDFSQYDINTMGYYHSSSYLLQAQYAHQENMLEDSLISYIENWIQEAVDAQNSWDFNSSISFSTMALCGYAEIYGIVDDHCQNYDFELITSENPISSEISTSDPPSTTEPSNYPIILTLILGVAIPVIFKKSRFKI